MGAVTGRFVRCGLMVVETEGEGMTFVEDKSRMTHSGFFRSGAPSTDCWTCNCNLTHHVPTSEMQANTATARTRRGRGRVYCNRALPVATGSVIVGWWSMVRASCGVVWCWKKNCVRGGRQVAAATAPDKFKSICPCAHLFTSSLLTFHSSPRAGSSCTGSAQCRGAISKAMMSSQVRGLISF